MHNRPTHVSLRFYTEPWRTWDDERTEEQIERQLMSFELPYEHCGPKRGLSMPIACRTLITALKGGRVKRLQLEKAMQLPFAVCRLLPYWVGIENWGNSRVDPVWDFGDDDVSGWCLAAMSLRPLLAHCYG